MTKEQEEAIENLKGMLEYKRQVYNMDTMRNEIVPALYDIDRKAIETVLSMLKEKDTEIEEYKRMIATGIINTAKDELVQEKNKEIEKKDKIIDLMAETIRKLAISLANYKGSYNKETINFTGSIKDIKQYFERKSEE